MHNAAASPLVLLFARRKNATREKIWLTKGQFSLGPLECCSRQSVRKSVGIIVHPRQTHKKSSEGEGGRTPPALCTQVSVHAGIWGGIWGVICIESGGRVGGNLVAPSGETRKSHRKARPGLIRWVMRIPCAISQTLGAEWRIYIYLGCGPDENLSELSLSVIHPLLINTPWIQYC